MGLLWSALGLLTCGILIAFGVMTVSDPADAQRTFVYLSRKRFLPLLDEHVANSPLFRTYLVLAGTASSVMGLIFAIVIVIAMISRAS